MCRENLAACLPDDLRPTHAIGVAGTVTTLATLDLGLDAEDPELVHGHRLARGWIEATLRELADSRVDEIRQRGGIHPDRAPVIVAGVVAVLETLHYFGLEELEVSEHDLMHGAALLAADLPAPLEGDAPPGAYTCC